MLATSFSARCRCSQQLLRMVRIRNGRNLCSDKQQEEEMRNVLESSSKWSITNYYIIINSGTSSCCVSLKDKNALARARDEGMTQLLTCYLSVVFYYCSNNKPQGSSNALECQWLSLVVITGTLQWRSKHPRWPMSGVTLSLILDLVSH